MSASMILCEDGRILVGDHDSYKNFELAELKDFNSIEQQIIGWLWYGAKHHRWYQPKRCGDQTWAGMLKARRYAQLHADKISPTVWGGIESARQSVRNIPIIRAPTLDAEMREALEALIECALERFPDYYHMRDVWSHMCDLPTETFSAITLARLATVEKLIGEPIVECALDHDNKSRPYVREQNNHYIHDMTAAWVAAGKPFGIFEWEPGPRKEHTYTCPHCEGKITNCNFCTDGLSHTGYLESHRYGEKDDGKPTPLEIPAKRPVIGWETGHIELGGTQ